MLVAWLLPQGARSSTKERSNMPPDFKTLDGNEAVASVAYRLSEVIAIYPITPASPMGEHSDDWAAIEKRNIWGDTPRVVEMQSEAGAAGAVHGALQGGALATTFTASQGLLLMLPNMLKIAGELTPFCVHVAARSLATHALSIFGDHADVMLARGTGFALVASGSVQEAQDLAAISHATTLESRIPILHFFDGFRTSHEVSKIVSIDNEQLKSLISNEAISEHRKRRMTPDHPVVRGTSQNPDAFFQAREAANPVYDAFFGVYNNVCERFYSLTGRRYGLFEYVGDPEAERVIIMMGSGAECAHETVDYLQKKGEKVGLLKIRVYRPFPADQLIAALPKTVKHIAVLDRTKEAGSQGEPLIVDVASTFVDQLTTGKIQSIPRIIGGRYGLSSREFTPAMVKSIYDELAKASPKTRFTVGIRDDVTKLSLDVDESFETISPNVKQALFYGRGADGTVSSNKASIKILGEETDLFAQGHFVYDSKKSGSMTVSHLRFGPEPIRSSYQITKADFLAIHDPTFVDKIDLLEQAADNATVLMNTPVPKEEIWDKLPLEAQRTLIERKCKLYVIDAYSVASEAGLGRRINTVMQICFFALSKVLPQEEALKHIKDSIAKTWGKRGPEVVKRNLAAVDASLAHLFEVPIPAQATSTKRRLPSISGNATDFVKRVTQLLLDGHGDRLPVSAFPIDGTWPTATSQYEKRAIALEIPIWEADLCIQCNRCSLICPHAAIRTKVFEPETLKNAPEGFKSIPKTQNPELEGLQYTVQVAPEDCTGCGLCVEVCPAKDRKQPKRRSINMQPLEDHREKEAERYAFFAAAPEIARSRIPRDAKSLYLLQPLFEFSGACAGCGETPYVKLLTQLVGDRLLIANATGCSSIYGGNLPTTPYCVDNEGRGPAWNNSLFEDAAEFGMGIRLGADSLQSRANVLLQAMASRLPAELVAALQEPCETTNEAQIEKRRADVKRLRTALEPMTDSVAGELKLLADHLTPKSLWVIGGDGWAYDIGYGGLDHVLASGLPVKLLVLDTEVYSNTGGQQSKATPLGAVAKFAAAGKSTRKKDLGLLAMSYGHVYVAQIGLQAKNPHAVKAILEAESYPGPALVICHSPCIAHGYDLIHSPAQQKRAIDSWAWPLYRFDPRRTAEGLPPLQLEIPEKPIPMRKFAEEEARFRMVELRDPERYQHLLKEAEKVSEERRALYTQLAGIHFENTKGGSHA